ncbi:MAG: hypothetical protein AAB011_03680 [Candidatus Eisenbacteria bacterium]
MNRWGPLRLASAVVFAFVVLGEGAPSHADVPDESVAPVALYAMASDSTAMTPMPAAAPASTPSEPAPPPLASAGDAAEASAPVAPEAESATKTTTPSAAPPKPLVKRSGKPATKPTTKPAKPTVNPDKGTPDESARARQAVERTETILRSVKTKVARSFNRKAREEFETATAHQQEAREAFSENLYARAERLTMEARGTAREIAVHLGPPEDDPDYVAMTLDRTDDALGRAREVLRDGGGNLERDRLAPLERRQKEARRLEKDGATRRAYAMTRDVRDGVLTLLRECNDLPVREETAEKALKRASRALEQAKGELGDRLNTAADRLAREARAQMAKARASFARKNYRDTLLHSKLVERNLELAVSAQRSATNRT